MPRTIELADLRAAARDHGAYILSPDPHVAAAEVEAIRAFAESGAIVATAIESTPNAAIGIELR